MAFGWLIEFILESAGAVLYWRRNKLLSCILAFCSSTDALAVILRQYLSGTTIYGWYAWSQFALKELSLIWLGCMICGMMVKEEKKSVAILSAAFMSISTCAMVVVFAFQGETIKDRLLDGEISVTIILLVIVAVAWISKLGEIPAEWRVITLGLLVMVGGDFVHTLLWKHWQGAQDWQQWPTIAAQLVWIIGPLRTVRLSECRADLGQRIVESERVSVC